MKHEKIEVREIIRSIAKHLLAKVNSPYNGLDIDDCGAQKNNLIQLFMGT
jgi:hypothetical protein